MRGKGRSSAASEDTLEFIHGFDAADAFRPRRDGEGRGAFALRLRSRLVGMQRDELQAEIGQDLGDGANFLPGGVVEVAAGGEDFDGLKACAGDLREISGVGFLETKR